MSFGTLTYNGYSFGELSHLTCVAEQVYDDAERTASYNRYRFRCDTIAVAGAGETDANDHFENVREKLTSVGQAFTIADKGFGPSLTVNSGGAQDVAGGPKPRIVAWNPVGHTNAVEFTWECEVCIPDCTGAPFTGISGFNYSVDYAINPRGYTTRTIDGYLEIAMTRDGAALPDTADAYREDVESSIRSYLTTIESNGFR